MRRFNAGLLFLLLLVGVTILLTQGPKSSGAERPATRLIKKRRENNREHARPATALPDFSAIDDIQLKKETFFGHILPLVTQVNAQILAQRERLQRLQNSDHLSITDQKWLTSIARQYRMKSSVNGFDANWFSEALTKVDAIPPSLALAQAAKESGWGSSRFAREGNNYFGQWCFIKGCGLVPRARRKGLTHELQTFDDMGDSVRSYIHNLNSHPLYAALRELRAKARNNRRTVSGTELAQGLLSYSERGQAYIDEVIMTIHNNNLQRLDNLLELANH